MISCVGAPAAAMRRAMPTRPEWPEKPDPSPAAAAAASDAARDRGRRQPEQRRRPVRICRPHRRQRRHRRRRQVDGARLRVRLRAAHAQPARTVIPARRVLPDQRGRLAAAQARVRQHPAQRDIDPPAASLWAWAARSTAPLSTRSATTLAIADSICWTLGNGQTAGRMTALRFPADAGNLWRAKERLPLDGARKNGGMLASLKVGQ